VLVDHGCFWAGADQSGHRRSRPDQRHCSQVEGRFEMAVRFSVLAASRGSASDHSWRDPALDDRIRGYPAQK
jgi:hypothetical protein